MNYLALHKNSFTKDAYDLIPIRQQDMEPIRQWRNAQMEVLRQKQEITPKGQQHYFKQVVTPLFGQRQPGQLLFSLLKGTDLIGYGGLVHLSWMDKRAEMSFLVDDKRAANPHIYGEDMFNFIEMMKQLCFEEMKFNRLFTETYEFRKFHISILERAGLKEEGRLRQHIFEQDGFYDSLIHSILRKEYFEE